jgi:hypothetical protein
MASAFCSFRNTSSAYRHPGRSRLRGGSLPIISSITRSGIAMLLIMHPNGSRSLIPASWTNSEAVGITDVPCTDRCRQSCSPRFSICSTQEPSRTLSWGAAPFPQPEPAAPEESYQATAPGVSRTIAAANPKDQLDVRARAEAIKILSRIIAQTFPSTEHMQTSDE